MHRYYTYLILQNIMWLFFLQGKLHWPQIVLNNSNTSELDHFKMGLCCDYKYNSFTALLLRTEKGESGPILWL